MTHPNQFVCRRSFSLDKLLPAEPFPFLLSFLAQVSNFGGTAPRFLPVLEAIRMESSEMISYLLLVFWHSRSINFFDVFRFSSEI